MGDSRHRNTQIARAVARLLRVGSLCAPAALLGAMPALAHASDTRPLTADIPSQPLAQALEAFRRQTGLQLIYVSSLISNQRSQPVTAGTPGDEALAHLLRGTTLTFEHLSARSIRIFAAAAAPHAAAAGALATEVHGEVIITASRNEEQAQDIPLTIQFINADRLKQLNVTNTYDLLKYTTNVTFSGDGPGTGNIYMRGLGGSSTGSQSQSTIAAFPNVALYLDDQSMLFPARNNDVYLVDMERVEILEGPQETLFGAGAQAGVIRYVTNKPNLTATQGDANASYGITSGGDPNASIAAVLNVSLITNTLAARAVLFSDHRGGYLDNVPGTISYLPGSIPAVLGGNPSANNGALQGNNVNSVNVEGMRLSALWKASADWDVLLQQNYQDMHANGYFFAYPTSTDGRALQHYQATTFEPSYNKDRYSSTALTVRGRINSNLDVLYSGSYMSRHIDAQQDYSSYLRNTKGAYYYACIGPGAGYFNSANFPALEGSPLHCATPLGNWHDQTSSAHQSHEVRLTTRKDARWRALLGGYWEKFVVYDNMNFNYLGLPQCDPGNLGTALQGGIGCITAVGPYPGSYAGTPGLRTGTNTAFGEDVQRGYKQTAAFTSVDLDLIPDRLTITGGARWYRYYEFESGSEYFVEDGTDHLVVNHPNGTCTSAGDCGIPIQGSQVETGHRLRGSLAWHLAPDVMAYYTYSEGLNPGGFNRATHVAGQPTLLRGAAQYTASDGQTQQWGQVAGYDADSVINNEVGIKSEFLQHRILLNLSAYYMQWENSQQLLFDPAHLATIPLILNGPSYIIRGVEVQFVARLTEGLTVQGSSSNNSASQTNAPCLRSVGVDPNTTRTTHNPTPRGECITQIRDAPYTNPFGPQGSRPPFSPPWMFNLQARYEWNSGAYRPFAWVGATHMASMSNQPANYPSGNGPDEDPPTTTLLRYQIPGYTTYDAGLGVVKDRWTAQLQGHNLSNVYGPANITSSPLIKAEVPLHPRVVTLLLGYSF